MVAMGVEMEAGRMIGELCRWVELGGLRIAQEEALKFHPKRFDGLRVVAAAIHSWPVRGLRVLGAAIHSWPVRGLRVIGIRVR
jgi:hypothetical protein